MVREGVCTPMKGDLYLCKGSFIYKCERGVTELMMCDSVRGG